MGGAHSEREDFAKSAQRDVIDPFHVFGSSINLTYRKKCRCTKKQNHSQNLLGGGEGEASHPLDRTLDGGVGGWKELFCLLHLACFPKPTHI